MNCFIQQAPTVLLCEFCTIQRTLGFFFNYTGTCLWDRPRLHSDARGLPERGSLPDSLHLRVLTPQYKLYGEVCNGN